MRQRRGTRLLTTTAAVTLAAGLLAAGSGGSAAAAPTAARADGTISGGGVTVSWTVPDRFLLGDRLPTSILLDCHDSPPETVIDLEGPATIEQGDSILDEDTDPQVSFGGFGPTDCSGSPKVVRADLDSFFQRPGPAVLSTGISIYADQDAYEAGDALASGAVDEAVELVKQRVGSCERAAAYRMRVFAPLTSTGVPDRLLAVRFGVVDARPDRLFEARILRDGVVVDRQQARSNARGSVAFTDRFRGDESAVLRVVVTSPYGERCARTLPVATLPPA